MHGPVMRVIRVKQVVGCALLTVGALATAWAQQPTSFHPDVAPSEFVTVKHDELKLSAAKPNAWASGTPLPGLMTGDVRNGIGRITEEGALDPKSLVLTYNGKTLVEGKDYLVDGKWGTLGIGPAPSVTTNDTVVASYRYFLLRLDSVVRGVDGKEHVKAGMSNVTLPHPPELAAGEVRVANIYVPYQSDGKSDHTLLFPVLESAQDALTHSVAGRIPRTLEKLRSGQPVKIVCWGDSITAGGGRQHAAGPLSSRLRERVEGQVSQVEPRSEGRGCWRFNFADVALSGQVSIPVARCKIQL